MATRRPNVVSAPRTSTAAADFQQLLARLNPKTRVAVDKHLELSSQVAALGNGKLWKRLAGLLGRLAPHVVEVRGAALKYHIADGKYRQQVFALEDNRQGMIRVYMGDIVKTAVARGVLGASDSRSFPVLEDSGTRVELHEVSSENKPGQDFYRPMLGWGRRAVYADLSVDAEEKQVRAVEMLCELAAEAWAVPAGGPAKQPAEAPKALAKSKA